MSIDASKVHSTAATEPIQPIMLCISRFNEDMEWINDPCLAQFSKLIYNKGGENIEDVVGKWPVINLRNVGRECHTFLYHIVDNYDNLAELTVFLPGSCMGQQKLDTTQRTLKSVIETRNSVILGAWCEHGVHRKWAQLTIDSHVGTNVQNQEKLPDVSCMPSMIRPFAKWYEHYFGDLVVKVACLGSILAVHKRHILQRPKDHYQNLLTTLENHSNPEDGHFVERSWVAIFHPLPESCLIAPRPPPPLQQLKKVDLTGLSFKEILAMRKKKPLNQDFSAATVERGRSMETHDRRIEDNDIKSRSRSREKKESKTEI